MKFTESHEWVEQDASNIVTVGVTEFAQHELGDIVYVELPKIGKDIKARSEVAVLESTKAAADVYSPVSGTIVEVNQNLVSASELVNKSPEKDGWLFKIKLADPSELDALMDRNSYLKTIKQ